MDLSIFTNDNPAQCHKVTNYSEGSLFYPNLPVVYLFIPPFLKKFKITARKQILSCAD